MVTKLAIALVDGAHSEESGKKVLEHFFFSTDHNINMVCISNCEAMKVWISRGLSAYPSFSYFKFWVDRNKKIRIKFCTFKLLTFDFVQAHRDFIKTPMSIQTLKFVIHTKNATEKLSHLSSYNIKILWLWNYLLTERIIKYVAVASNNEYLFKLPRIIKFSLWLSYTYTALER